VTGGDVAAPPLVVLMPVYDDWPLVPRLLARLDAALAGSGVPVEALVVDDGSPGGPDGWPEATPYRAIRDVTALRLARNLGHQRAIAVGLAYLHAHRPGRTVVVMDADGEDVPEHVVQLLEAHRATPGAIVLARRTRRSEGLVFRLLYRLYRLTHRVLTGVSISFGNFSLVPADLLPRLVGLPELWNHYPATVVKARLPCVMVPLDRGPRLGGRSRMRLTGLVLHGLGALAVHGDVIGARALLATLAGTGLCALGIAIVVTIRLFTTLAIPGWASFVVGVLVAILLQTILLSLVFVFITLNSRSYLTVLPRRDFAEFVAGEERLYP
jgi:hypothetical protein